MLLNSSVALSHLPLLTYELPISECDPNNFGKDCNNNCHCAVDGCNQTTGVCDDPQQRCDVGWSGPSCSGKVYLSITILPRQIVFR